MLNLTSLPGLRSLHIISNAFTALDVRAVTEFPALTSLHLEDAQDCTPHSVRSNKAASTVAEVQHLSLLTNLQQLSITA
jgi:hypothetical protein